MLDAAGDGHHASSRSLGAVTICGTEENWGNCSHAWQFVTSYSACRCQWLLILTCDTGPLAVTMANRTGFPCWQVPLSCFAPIRLSRHPPTGRWQIALPGSTGAVCRAVWDAFMSRPQRLLRALSNADHVSWEGTGFLSQLGRHCTCTTQRGVPAQCRSWPVAST